MAKNESKDTIRYLVERRAEMPEDAPDLAAWLREHGGDVWIGVGVYDAATRDKAIEAAVEAIGDPDARAGTYRATALSSVGDPVVVSIETQIKVKLTAQKPKPPAKPRETPPPE